MNSKLRSTVKVIANAVERDTESLKELIRRNGIQITTETKGQLQKITTGALMKSEAFRREFRAWVLRRSGADRHVQKSADGIPDILVYPTMGPANEPSMSTTSVTQPAPAGFWSGVSMNSLLEFASSNFNTYAEVVKSNADKAMVDAAIEKERLEQATAPAAEAPKSKTGTYILIAVAIAAVIGTGVYFYQKQK